VGRARVILADYHLSTVDRRPQYELPAIDDATARSNPVAAMFAAYQKSGAYATPRSLKDNAGPLPEGDHLPSSPQPRRGVGHLSDRV